MTVQSIHSTRMRRVRRQARTRARVRGTAALPRLSVFRSNRILGAQLIDDVAGRTLASASDRMIKPALKSKKRPDRRQRAAEVGRAIATEALAQNIRAVRFDRGSYRYHGIVAALAAGARKGGLKF